MNDFDKIEEYIPHRAPIIMLDEILSIKGFEIKTSYQIKKDCIFVTEGKLQETGLIENMAQTSFVFLKALFADINNTDFQDEEKTLGFISSIKKLSIMDLPEIGEKLITTTVVDLVFKSPELKIIDVKGFSYKGKQKVFESEMKMLVQTQS
ncbi:hypothetical protein [Apibacter sp. HY039]|uniref:hypothetical protein n=1 Tax=Apibacter sp. HY039 TaxID=2501476 RepID=UPI000FEB9C42|nr:hypothetical protein [Apibacter sp. HY039]